MYSDDWFAKFNARQSFPLYGNRTIFSFRFWFEAAAQWHDQSVTLQCCDTASMQWNHLVQVAVVRKWAWSWLGGGCGLTPGGEVLCEYYVLWGRKGGDWWGAVQSLLGKEVTEFLLLFFHWFLQVKLQAQIIQNFLINGRGLVVLTFTSSDFLMHSSLVTPSTNITCKAIL